jgi:hypothetical protein
MLPLLNYMEENNEGFLYVACYRKWCFTVPTQQMCYILYSEGSFNFFRSSVYFLCFSNDRPYIKQNVGLML